MPSPFPGMDLLLEHPGVFPDLHDSLIFCLRESMQARLPEPYFAMIRDRLWVEVSERQIEPDVHVRKGKRGSVPAGGAGEDASVGVLTRSKPLRSEEHTSELQSRPHLVCRLLLEKKNR